MDYTINYIGTKRITATGSNPPVHQRDQSSPSYVLMNAQLSKSLGKNNHTEVYLGGENLTNFLQRDAILSPDQPFGPYFDAAMIWGPVTGRMFYAGFRYKLK